MIFDCDGVLVDSEAMSCYSLNLVFEKEYEIDIGNDYSEVLGTSLIHSLTYFLNKFNIKNYDILHLAASKEAAYFSLAKNKLRSFENCSAFIDLLKSKGFSVSVGSSGSIEKIKFSLTQVNLLKKFEFITSSSEVEKGKPNPDLFLECSKKINVDPSNCIVIEDSVNGIKAAKTANMFTIGLTTSFNSTVLKEAGADLIIDHYAQLIEILNKTIE